MLVQVDRKFDGLFVYNVGYVTKENTPDGPKTNRDVVAVLAGSAEAAIGVARQLVAPLDMTVLEMTLGLDGSALHYAPAYDA